MLRRISCAISLMLLFCYVDGSTFQIWSASKRVPLIFTAYQNAVMKGDLYQISTDTKAYESAPFQYDHYTFPAGNDRNGVKWMSFPSLDRLYGTESMAYTFFDPLQSPYILTSIQWKELSNSTQSMVASDFNWTGDNHQILPQQGYKIQMNTDLQNPITITTPAIKPNPQLQMSLIARTSSRSSTPDNENWLGYFNDLTLHPFVAFASVLDNLWYIQSQNWTLSRMNVLPGSPWIIIADVGDSTPKLSYGDMVVVKCFEDADFTWNTPTIGEEPYVRAVPEKFSFIEKMEYVPVYVEFEGNDLPKEAAVYLEGVCKGAAVVKSSSVEIPAYIFDDYAYGMELEVRLYYDNKAAYNPIPRYQTWNMETQEYDAQSLSLKERKPYYMLKLDTASINDTPVPKLYMGSFPNPFNPDTTLRFSLPEAAEITLDIYNVKGQKVRNVASGSYNSGTHTCNWDAKDSSGNRVASGLYFAILSYQGKQISRKLMLMK